MEYLDLSFDLARGSVNNQPTRAILLQCLECALKVTSTHQNGEAGAQQPECTVVHEDCEQRPNRYHGMRSTFKVQL